jgi:hypothetical protein
MKRNDKEQLGNAKIHPAPSSEYYPASGNAQKLQTISTH